MTTVAIVDPAPQRLRSDNRHAFDANIERDSPLEATRCHWHHE
jgi:hypothetical protein